MILKGICWEEEGICEHDLGEATRFSWIHSRFAAQSQPDPLEGLSPLKDLTNSLGIPSASPSGFSPHIFDPTLSNFDPSALFGSNTKRSKNSHPIKI